MEIERVMNLSPNERETSFGAAEKLFQELKNTFIQRREITVQQRKECSAMMEGIIKSIPGLPKEQQLEAQEMVNKLETFLIEEHIDATEADDNHPPMDYYKIAA